MGKNSGIQWTDHTFNPWWGCTRVSPGCDHCYAATLAARVAPGVDYWGPEFRRREFGAKHWEEPRTWNAHAARFNRRDRVFCASMADVFDNQAPAGVRDRLWTLIRETPQLDWLLLTKRAGNIASMLPADWSKDQPGYANVWLGISVVNQAEADRDIPKLVAVPARMRFLSCEPMLGPINLWPHLKEGGLHWVIIGGESGAHARAMPFAWAADIINACRSYGTPAFMKQLSQHDTRHYGEFDKFPINLRVREFPRMVDRT